MLRILKQRNSSLQLASLMQRVTSCGKYIYWLKEGGGANGPFGVYDDVGGGGGGCGGTDGENRKKKKKVSVSKMKH